MGFLFPDLVLPLLTLSFFIFLLIVDLLVLDALMAICDPLLLNVLLKAKDF
jgi:hypothetical protein